MLRPDGLVDVRPAMVLYDAPMYEDYRWVAMLDPVELADGRDHDTGDPDWPALIIDAVSEVEHAGRPAWEAVVRTTDVVRAALRVLPPAPDARDRPAGVRRLSGARAAGLSRRLPGAAGRRHRRLRVHRGHRRTHAGRRGTTCGSRRSTSRWPTSCSSQPPRGPFPPPVRVVGRFPELSSRGRPDRRPRAARGARRAAPCRAGGPAAAHASRAHSGSSAVCPQPRRAVDGGLGDLVERGQDVVGGDVGQAEGPDARGVDDRAAAGQVEQHHRGRRVPALADLADVAGGPERVRAPAG